MGRPEALAFSSVHPTVAIGGCEKTAEGTALRSTDRAEPPKSVSAERVALGRGDRREVEEVGHVTDCVDVGYRRGQLVVDDDRAVLREFDTCLLKTEVGGIGGAAGCDQDLVAEEGRTITHGGLQAVAGASDALGRKAHCTSTPWARSSSVMAARTSLSKPRRICSRR